MKKLYIIFLALLSATVLPAQQFKWEQINNPEGGKVEQVGEFKSTLYLNDGNGGFWVENSGKWTNRSPKSFRIGSILGDDSQRVYVSGNVGAYQQGGNIYYTEDLGLTWHASGFNRYTSKVNWSVDNETIYAFTYDSLFYSSDGAESWEFLRSFKEYEYFRYLAVGSTGNLYLVNGDSLERSTDQGASWEVSFYQPDGYLSSVIETNNQTLFTRTLYTGDDHMYKSTDEGRSWNKTTHNLLEIYVHASGLLFGIENDNVLRSEDDGETWSTVFHLGDNKLERIHLTERSDIYIVSGEDLFHSNDYGLTWNKKYSFESFFYQKLFVDSKKNIYQFGYDHSLTRSTDHGAHWNSYSVGYNNLKIKDFVVGDIETYFAVANGQAMKSSNHGKTWEATDTLQFANVARSENGTLFISSRNSYTDENIYYSTDNGTTWEDLEWPFEKKYYGMVVGSNNQLFVKSNSEQWSEWIYHTDDFGKTWTEIKANVSSGDWSSIRNVFITSEGHYLISVHDSNWNHSSYISSNNGETWTELERPGTEFMETEEGLYMAEYHSYFIWRASSLMHSSDGGITWNLIEESSEFARTAKYSFTPNNKIYKLSSDSLLVRNHVLNTWDVVGIHPLNNRIDELKFGQDERLYARDFDNNIYKNSRASEITSVSEQFEVPAISVFNYPNPVEDKTTIIYSLPRPAYVSISIYNMSGRLVNKWLIDEVKSGRNEISWNRESSDGRRLEPGIYLCKVQSSEQVSSSRMLLK